MSILKSEYGDQIDSYISWVRAIWVWVLALTQEMYEDDGKMVRKLCKCICPWLMLSRLCQAWGLSKFSFSDFGWLVVVCCQWCCSLVTHVFFGPELPEAKRCHVCIEKNLIKYCVIVTHMVWWKAANADKCPCFHSDLIPVKILIRIGLQLTMLVVRGD